MIRFDVLLVFGLIVVGILAANDVFLQKQLQNDKYTPEDKTLIKEGYGYWLQFKTKFEKKFESETTESEHMLTYLKARIDIDEHNKLYAEGKVAWYKAENPLTDLPPHLFALLNGYRPAEKPENATVFRPSLKDDAPASIDWRDYGFVTDVKNQGEVCGSCWAFASTGAIEGQHKRVTGDLISLSEQDLIDCNNDDLGCNGGNIPKAFYSVYQYGGIDTEDSYGYEAVDNQCRFNADNIGATVSGIAIIPSGDEGTLEAAVGTQGPVAVGISVSDNFQNYGGGIYYDDDCTTTGINHAVLVVGYGRDSDDYWIVKNSWGSGWGDGGYIRMARKRNNQCGIATDASFPLM